MVFKNNSNKRSLKAENGVEMKKFTPQSFGAKIPLKTNSNVSEIKEKNSNKFVFRLKSLSTMCDYVGSNYKFKTTFSWHILLIYGPCICVLK